MKKDIIKKKVKNEWSNIDLCFCSGETSLEKRRICRVKIIEKRIPIWKEYEIIVCYEKERWLTQMENCEK